MIPAVWFNPSSTRLHICTALNGRNLCYDSQTLPLHKYTKVEIAQVQMHGTEYFYVILVGGQRVYQTVNTHARYFHNVKVYKANPWQLAADADIKNLVFRNLKRGMCFSFIRRFVFTNPIHVE